MANYAFTRKVPLPAIPEDKTFEYFNFTQKLPHTKIFEGITGLIFKNCNLLNCDIPADAITESCLRIHVEYCANLHPEFEAEEENCPHVIDIDEIYDEGVLVETIYHYKDKVIT